MVLGILTIPNDGYSMVLMGIIAKLGDPMMFWIPKKWF